MLVGKFLGKKGSERRRTFAFGTRSNGVALSPQFNSQMLAFSTVAKLTQSR